ncbi:LOW QUALITY PROTEIN: uncharacterized protein PS065_020170 [Dugong dugon]
MAERQGARRVPHEGPGCSSNPNYVVRVKCSRLDGDCARWHLPIPSRGPPPRPHPGFLRPVLVTRDSELGFSLPPAPDRPTPIPALIPSVHTPTVPYRHQPIPSPARRFILVKPDDSQPSFLPFSLEPLLTTIREESYTLGKELCIWGLLLSNPEVARLALFLESKGHMTYPFTTLEIIDCQMDPWSLGRLGKALQFSSLLSLVLDYCKFGNEEQSIFSGLENSQRLQGLSLRYCGLGPQSGLRLGAVLSRSAICELHLDGNYLQCSGALALLRPLAEYAEMQRKDYQRIKKKIKDVSEAGPWLVKLHLADNGIDGRGKEGENDLLEFAQVLTCLIKYSAQLRELDLGNNVLGEMAAADILEALRVRKTFKVFLFVEEVKRRLAWLEEGPASPAKTRSKWPLLKITVTSQISSDIFRSIWKNCKKSSITRKKKKKEGGQTFTPSHLGSPPPLAASGQEGGD